MHKAKWWTPYLFLLPVIIGLVVFRLVPIGTSIVESLFDVNPRGVRTFAGLQNYVDLFGSATFWSSFRTTVLFNVVANSLQICLAFSLALLVFRPTRGIGIFRTAFFLPISISIAMASLLWMVMLDPNLGVVNVLLKEVGLDAQPFFRSPNQALWSMIWIVTWKYTGFWMLFLLAGLCDIPRELYEAAQIDGASWWGSFRRVTLPLMKRPLAFVLVLVTSVNFLQFAPVYLITKGGPMRSTNLLMYTAYDAAFLRLDQNRAMTTSTVVLLIIALFTIVGLRLLDSKETIR